MSIRSRLYWSLVVAAVVGCAWNEWKAWPEANGLVQVIALLSPSVTHWMKIEWLTRGFTMGFTAVFIGLSGKKVASKETVAPTRLPVYVEALDRDEFYFVLGEEVSKRE